MIATPPRRQFFRATGGLLIGLYLMPSRGPAQPLPAAADFAPNAFVRIASDSTVSVLIKHMEMGHGPMTGLTTLVAEELDADWSQMRARHAPADARLYRNLFYPPTKGGHGWSALTQLQGTSGSIGMANSYEQMRRAGAAARSLLVQAASDKWGVPKAEITVAKGILRHPPSGRSTAFGPLVESAAKLPVPQEVVLKDSSEFRLIGREHAVQRIDTVAKTDGSAIFTQDVNDPGMLTAVVMRPPRFGGQVASFDARAARAVKGVVDVKSIPEGVVVYATSTYAAIKGRRALTVRWDDSAAETRGSEEMLDELRSLARTPGVPATVKGDVDSALKSAERVIEAEFVFPFLAHAPMETLDGTLVWDGKKAFARYASQMQTLDQDQIAHILDIRSEDVAIETLFAGGSFGRRIDAGHDMVAELAYAAKALGPKRPVKLIWTREDDIRGGFYRPMMVHRMQGAIRGGKITGWSDTAAGQAWALGTPLEPWFIKDGVDRTMFEPFPYAVENFRSDAHIAKSVVPTTSMRSIGGTHATYAVECFMDDMLDAVGQDPVTGRLALMGGDPPFAEVLKAVAEMADWRGPKPVAGRGRGVAVYKSHGAYVAQIAEVSVADSGEPRVHKVWCALNCGVVVNPDVVRAQMEGGIGYGLGMALFGDVPFANGRPVPSNFDTYRSLRIDEMPQVEVRTLASTARPGGVGERGVPSIGPAVANALARLGRERTRRLPIIRRIPVNRGLVANG